MTVIEQIAAAVAERDRIEEQVWRRNPGMPRRRDLLPYLMEVSERRIHSAICATIEEIQRYATPATP